MRPVLQGWVRKLVQVLELRNMHVCTSSIVECVSMFAHTLVSVFVCAEICEQAGMALLENKTIPNSGVGFHARPRFWKAAQEAMLKAGLLARWSLRHEL